MYIKTMNKLKSLDYSKLQTDNKCYPFANTDIYFSEYALIYIKKYDNWISLKEGWEKEQANILQIIRSKPEFSAKAYFFIIAEEFDIKDYADLDINIIERDYHICKKYVINIDSDFSRIPLLNNIDFILDNSGDYELKFHSSLLDVLKDNSDLLSTIHSTYKDISKNKIDNLIKEISQNINNYFINEKVGD